MKEIWKSIKGYEGLYQISNLGRVRSLDSKSIFNRWRFHKTLGKYKGSRKCIKCKSNFTML